MKQDPEEMLSARLGELAAYTANREASPHVEARLRMAFQARRQRRRWVWAAAAALAAAGVLLFAVRWRPETVPPAPVVERAAVKETAPVVEKPSEPAPIEAPKSAAAPVSRPRQKKPPAPREEIVTDFFPMRNGPLVDPDEMTSVIRVVVPSSTMRRFGLTTAIGGETRVQADVLLGQDGMARAIRFVRDR